MKKFLIGLLTAALLGNVAYGYSGGPLKGIDVGIGARATEKMFLQMGSSSTFTWHFGIDPVTGSGTAGYAGTTTGLPSIEVSRSGGSSSVNIEGFNSVKIDGVDIATGSLDGKLDAVGGVGTNTTLNNPTIAGAGTVSATMSYNGVSISPTEVSRLDGVSQNIQTSLDGKQGAGTYITGIIADGKTGTTTATLVPGPDMSIVAVESNGAITMTFQPTGSASAKTDVLEGGGTTTVGAAFLNYNASDFDTANNTPGTDIALSAEQRGTTTPAANHVVKADSSGRIENWLIGSGNDQYTKLLLHGDQVGSLSTYLDSSEQEWTVTSVGSVIGTTTDSVFGGASFYYSGTNNRLTLSDTSRLELGSNDFIIDWRAKFTDSSYMFTKEQSAATDYLTISYDSTNDKLSFHQKSGGAWVIQADSGSCTVSSNTWYHFAVVRKNNKFRFYVDGSQKGSDVTDTDAVVDNTAGWSIGGVPSDSNSFDGYLDEIRFTIGTGRKPAGNFTVPSVAYGSFTQSLSY